MFRRDAFLRRRVVAADPAASEWRRQQAANSRRVTRPVMELDGMAALAVCGPAEDVVAMWTAIDHAAKARRRAAAKVPGHPDAELALPALRFDVLADLAHTGLDRGHLGCCAPTCAGDAPRRHAVAAPPSPPETRLTTATASKGSVRAGISGSLATGHTYAMDPEPLHPASPDGPPDDPPDEPDPPPF